MTVLQSFTDAVDAIDIVKRSPVDNRIVKEKVVVALVVVVVAMMIVQNKSRVVKNEEGGKRRPVDRLVDGWMDNTNSNRQRKQEYKLTTSNYCT
jgi:hypothetical protein